ncbi:hypothetical protein BCR44DRAFT_1424697, partial [Catenaria anguillulae PL171]
MSGRMTWVWKIQQRRLSIFICSCRVPCTAGASPEPNQLNRRVQSDTRHTTNPWPLTTQICHATHKERRNTPGEYSRV